MRICKVPVKYGKGKVVLGVDGNRVQFHSMVNVILNYYGIGFPELIADSPDFRSTDTERFTDEEMEAIGRTCHRVSYNAERRRDRARAKLEADLRADVDAIWTSGDC